MLALVLALAACLTPAAAPAAQTHPFTGLSFGPDGSAASSFTRIGAVAIDPASANVYVHDAGEGKLYKFDAAGNPVDFSALGTNVIEGLGGAGAGETELAVAPPGSAGGTDGDIYLASYGSSVAIFAPSGQQLGELNVPESCGVATDPAGHVFIGAYPSEIREYVPSANPVAEGDQADVSTAKQLPGICNVAADGLGNVYAAHSVLNGGARLEGVVKLEGLEDDSPSDLPPPSGLTIAVDSASDDVYVDRGSSVAQFDSSGAGVNVFGSERLAESNGIAVDGASGKLYVANGDPQRVDVFGPLVTIATVNVQAATAITPSKATLHAVVDPEGLAVTDCKFEYGIGSSFDQTVPCEGAIPTDSANHPLTAALGGLQANTAYRFRINVEGANGPSQSEERTFTSSNVALTGAATAIEGTKATLNGVVFPEGELLADCKFEYRSNSESEFISAIPCAESPAAIGEGSGPVSVHADLTGLGFETFYFFRMAVTNADGTAQGKTRSFTTSGLPLIEAEQTSGVTDTEAELIVRINPSGLATTYRLEYGTATTYGQSTAEIQVGADEIPHTLTYALTGLAPDTVYHWRAVAGNSHGVSEGSDRSFTTYPTFAPETNCPNQALRNGAAANLPDCRAYEMVSPSRKLGEVIPPDPGGQLGSSCFECMPGVNRPAGMPMQSTADGQSVVYMGQPFFSGSASPPNEYLSVRTTDGWRTESLSPLQTGDDEGQGYTAFSPDLSRAVLFQIAPAFSAEAPIEESSGESFGNLYLKGKDGSLLPLVTETPPHRSAGSSDANRFRITFGGGNAGTTAVPAFSHLTFEANDALGKEFPGVLPATPEVGANEKNIYEWSDGEVRLVNVLPGNLSAVPDAVIGAGRLFAEFPGLEGPVVDHAISADGSRIFWSDKATGQVYVRIAGEETQRIENSGKFVTASSGGLSVLLSDGCLYGLETEACEDLTQGQGGFQGILGAADDLSRVYFVDTADLTGSEENANGERAEAGEFNLYHWENGATSFLGILLERDNNVGSLGLLGAWKAPRQARTSQVSPDGRYLAFMSRASLTGYDNEAESGECGFHKPPKCREVFAYDAFAKKLNCPSCNPSGARPQGESNLSVIQPDPSFFPLPQPGNLTTTGGGRLFFESQDVLSPHDSNGHIQDVYEWEPSGVGSCKQRDGCVYLISSGHSPNDSMFLTATPSGDNAFFITREQLLPQDKDQRLDLYDAHVGGGIAQTATPICGGEACKRAFPLAPASQSPGTSSFAGPGNKKACHKPKKCKKHRKHKHQSKKHQRSAKHNSGGSK